MLYRISQGFRFFFPGFTKEDDELAKSYLDKREYYLFSSMAKYDKKHSVNVLKMLLENKPDVSEEDFAILIKLALLHDCGKNKKIGLIERIGYAVFKKGKRLSAHPEKGAAVIDYDRVLSYLILNHHNKNCDNRLVKIFQEIDDKN